MQKRLRSISLWGFLSLFGAAVFGPLGQWFIQVASDKGYYTNAGTNWDAAMNAALSFLASPIVLYAAIFAFGVVVGTRLDVFARKRDEVAPELEEIRGKVFTNEVVDIDGKRFVRCEFHAVRLRHSGGAYALENNSFHGVPVLEPVGQPLVGFLRLLIEFDKLKAPVLGADGIIKPNGVRCD